ncbi:unnamed protein product [Linum tenue]|uniref:Uncharacterized protein n=1 Tax=Linum tenue TaxID=586396 RepID=A0AAV0LY11_9ROSI|nr:unnamed protein product [Linum tenue]
METGDTHIPFTSWGEHHNPTGCCSAARS